MKDPRTEYNIWNEYIYTGIIEAIDPRRKAKKKQIREVTGARSQGGKPSKKPFEDKNKSHQRVAIRNHREATGKPSQE